jgi:AraC family transcriptional regulator
MKSYNEAIIHKVLQKIEQELEHLNTDEIIEYSGFSYYHFHRIFSAYMAESLAQYIKRIRLERAAYKLNYKNISITQVAMSAGFATPSAFNKAFKDFFNTTPSLYKKTEIRSQEFTMIQPIEVVTIKPIDVYAIRHVGPYNEIGHAFEKLMKWAYTHKIKHKKNLMGKEAYGYTIAYDDPNVTDNNKLRSDACISADDEVEMEEGMVRQHISGGKYAVFLHKGPYDNLKKTYNDIFCSYVKKEDVQLRDVPVFEKYLNRDPRRTKPQNLKTQIYIPIH